MPRNNLYKAFQAKPVLAFTKDKVVLDTSDVLTALAEEVTELTILAEHHLTQDRDLLKDLRAYQDSGKFPTPNVVGRRLGIRLPEEFRKRGVGTSRREWMFQDIVIRHATSWLERSMAESGTSTSYISAGFKRTADSGYSTDLAPKISLSAVDRQYAYIESADDHFILWVVIRGQWRGLMFQLDHERFSGAVRLCMPDIVVDDSGKVRFHFSVEYEYVYGPISADYVVGVDIGVSDYLHAVVTRVSDGSIVEHTSLSQRAHSLYNSVLATQRQVASLKRLGRDEEASVQRDALSRKRRELAIIAAQEVADLAARWGNAVIAVEDLSHIVNTMRFGRWNRGEFVKWLTHFVELNGSRVMKVNAAYTSRKCHQCGGALTFTTYKTPRCTIHGSMDRDKNAAANIANRLVQKGTLAKVLATRKKSKTYVGAAIRRSAKKRETLKYPGRDRTKVGPTPKRPSAQKKIKEVKLPQCSATGNDDLTVVADELAIRPVRTLERQHENLYPLLL